ncbi:MAG: 50S ribosomal protein L11 methyltransferase [Candidatus Rariloculaceae bacterium]
MPWHQLEITLPAADLPKAESLLTLAGAEAFLVSDAASADILEPDPGSTPLWPSVVVQALYRSSRAAAAGRNVVASALVDNSSIRVLELREADWRETWTQRPTTRTIGERLAIVAANAPWQDSSRVAVRLNLGLAFGTGDHPTTSLCLEWLDRDLLPDTRVLDYGCGSGVLAVAALRLGAKSAWAVDIDQQALSATRENAELNGVSERLWVGKPDDLPEIMADVVIANILAQPLQNLASRLGEHVAPGGHIVLSGLLSRQSRSVQQAYAENFAPFIEWQRDDWACLVAQRN